MMKHIQTYRLLDGLAQDRLAQRRYGARARNPSDVENARAVLHVVVKVLVRQVRVLVQTDLGRAVAHALAKVLGLRDLLRALLHFETVADCGRVALLEPLLLLVVFEERAHQALHVLLLVLLVPLLVRLRRRVLVLAHHEHLVRVHGLDRLRRLALLRRRRVVIALPLARRTVLARRCVTTAATIAASWRASAAAAVAARSTSAEPVIAAATHVATAAFTAWTAV